MIFKNRKPRNQTPEKIFVNCELLPYLRKIGCSFNVIEAKATFNKASGRYKSQTVTPGYPDISGNFSNGHALYIEAKAPGKRSTLSSLQKMFLTEKIESNAFAAVIDSVDYLKDLLNKWSNLESFELKRNLLKSELP